MNTMTLAEARRITIEGWRNSGSSYYDAMTDDELIASVVYTHDAAAFADSTDRDEVALRIVLEAAAALAAHPGDFTPCTDKGEHVRSQRHARAVCPVGDQAGDRYSTREEWLVAAVEALAPIFSEVGETLPTVRVSVGWPGGRGPKNKVIGQCWKSIAANDKVSQLFVSPVLDDAAVVLSTLAHELVHAVDDCESGHKGRFTKIAKGIGLEGKMTATVAGEALAAQLAEIASDLGEYPHAALLSIGDGADSPKKQGTRMIKVECAEGSGYKARMTRSWLDELGAPKCPCHDLQMVEA